MTWSCECGSHGTKFQILVLKGLHGKEYMMAVLVSTRHKMIWSCECGPHGAKVLYLSSNTKQ